MKEKIERISKGEFHTSEADVIFSQTRLEIIVGEGMVYHGELTVSSKTQREIRGIVYTSSERMSLEEQCFDGKENVIHFTYDGKGLLPDDTEKGKFTVLCDGGEYEIFFAVFVQRPFLETSYGKIQNIKGFKRLAEQDYLKAVNLFRSRNFYKLVQYEDKKIFALYDNMRKWALDEQGLEEFLVGTKQKSKILLALSGEGSKINYLSENRKEVLMVRKNTWGFLRVQIEVRGEFLKVREKEFSTEEFIGEGYLLEYIVEKQKLHRGKNFGEIILRTPYQELHYSVEVLGYKGETGRGREEDLFVAQILKGYLPYAVGRSKGKEWQQEALGYVERLRSIRKEEPWYRLLQAHIHLLGGEKQEAGWILEMFEYQKGLLTTNPELACYYLFLEAQYKNDRVKTRKTVETLRLVYLKKSNSWMVACMLAQMDIEYKSYAAKLRFLEEQYKKGAHSLLFYLICYICYQEKGELLTSLTPFTLQVMNFATKRGLFHEELALQFVNLASSLKSYQEQVFQILARFYKKYESDTILTAIVTLLIKGNKVRKKDFQWYEKAVERELNLTKLYEYYIMTIQEEKVKEALPRVIHFYFAGGGVVDYKKEAFLYANLLLYENETSDLSMQYRERIRQFAVEQLMKRHINEHLRIIYKKILDEKTMTTEQVQALYDICHAYKITTDAPNIKSVLVIDSKGKIVSQVPYEEEGMIIFLWDEASRVVWESIGGYHYADSIFYELKRLFYEPHFLDYCSHYMEEDYSACFDEEAMAGGYDRIKEKGAGELRETELLSVCSQQIAEGNGEEDAFLTNTCFALLEKGLYDRNILSYLAQYYNGALTDMKLLWSVARKNDIRIKDLSERILSQMIFVDGVSDEEDIFIYCYENGMYFKLKRAYLAYVCRQYVVEERNLDAKLFQILMKEFQEKEVLADVCKIALLQYYAGKEYGTEEEKLLFQFMQELCGKRIVFPCYLRYPEDWLNEFFLQDKLILLYRGTGKVKLSYQIRKQNTSEATKWQTEVLMPMYEGIYSKKFILFEGEEICYYFEEILSDHTKESKKQIFIQKEKKSTYGKYGRLNYLASLSGDKKKEEMLRYQQEETLAEQMFQLY